jgi:hypothetical protein
MLVQTDSMRGTDGVTRNQRTLRLPVKNVQAVLDRDQARDLLVTLCEKLGYCLTPNEQERIVNEPPSTVYDFADAVLRSEGLDPATEKTLLNGVRTVVAAAFVRSSQPIEDKS